MRTLYFDCFSGASGDMINGALIDLGVDINRLQEELATLALEDYDIEATQTERAGLRGMKFDVRIERNKQPQRRLSDILNLIRSRSLPEGVKQTAVDIFQRLGEAEALVHGVAVGDVHFHEVGALDAIVDIVAACIGFHLLGVERFLSSPLNVGRGMIGCSHGRMPVPVAATAQLLKGALVYSTDVEAELVTPTGAAIISTLCESCGSLPEMRLEKIGYGAGSAQFENHPNMIRLLLGETEDDRVTRSSGSEKITVIEANIDDMNPQVFGYFMDKALKEGAVDIFYTPVQMKKLRPATQLTLLCRKEDRERLIELIFEETTTIGLRFHETERRILPRQFVEVQTGFGCIKVKVSYWRDKMMNFIPEYADCEQAAERHNTPVREVMRAATAAFERKMKN